MLSRALSMLLCLLLATNIYAGIEKFNARLTAAQMVAGTSTFGVEDDKFPTMLISQPISVGGSPLTFKQLNTTAFVVLGIDHEDMDFISTYGTYSFRLQIDYYDDYSYQHTVTQDLSVDYNTSSSYTDRAYYEIPGNAHQISVQITRLQLNGTTVALSSLPSNIYLEAEIDIDRCYQFNYGNIPGFTSATTTSDNELELKWSVVDGAEAYDLEWTYIDNYEYTSGPINLDFNNNGTRVTVSGNSYKIPLLYEQGYIAYRIRAVGRQWDDPTLVENGLWSTYDGVFDVTAATNKLLISPLDDDKNWQMQSTYAEEGKKKDVVTFFDGSLHNRQIVTKTNTDNNVIVGETIYDHQGRPAIQVLPVPVVGLTVKKIKYYNDFNQNGSSEPYTKVDFDEDAGGSCSTTVPAMSDNSGADKYYSDNNPEQDGFQKFVPKANGYPFSQTEYTDDNTGRIRNQSGVGPEHILGLGHETKYLYGQPTQQELTELFGAEAGDASHYKKNVVIDPNGQISTSYLNLAGKVVASSIAGEVPTNVETLKEGPPDTNGDPTEIGVENVTMDLLGLDANNKSNSNTINAQGNAIEFNYNLLVTQKADYTFNYDMTGVDFHNDCMDDGHGVNYCFECVYKMQILIIDECGQNLNAANGPVTIGTIKKDDCSSIGSPPSFTMTPLVLTDLDVGTYNIVKILSIDQDALDDYTEEYTKSPPNIYNKCYKPKSQWEDEAIANADESGCAMTCETCSTSVASRHTEFLANGGTEDEYQAALQECNDLCRKVSPCEMSYNMMLSDLRPGGQYAEFEINADGEYVTTNLPLSIFSEHRALYLTGISTPPIGGLWKSPVTPYLDPDGNPAKILVTQYTDASGQPAYMPEVSDASQIDPTDHTISPEYLTLKYFIANYNLNPQWAKSLAPYHPEYCYYDFCIQNTASDAFDNQMLTVDYTTAQGLWGSDLTTDLLASDPYFAVGGQGYDQAGEMADKIAHYPTGVAQTGDFNLWQIAALSESENSGGGTNNSIACNNAPDILDCLNTAFPGTGSTTRYLNDNTWLQAAKMYYAIKQTLMQKQSDIYVLTQCHRINSSTASLGQLNYCIGEEPGDALRDIVADFTAHSTNIIGYIANSKDQPCGWLTWWMYNKKIKRFPNRNSFGYDTDGDQDADLEAMKEKLDYQYFQSSGQCPLTKGLEGLINALLRSQALANVSSPTPLEYYTEFSQDLFNALKNTSTATGMTYTWTPTLSNIDKTLTVDIASSSTSTGQCSYLELNFDPTSAYNFNSTELSSFTGLTYTGSYVSSGITYYTFNITANITPSTGPPLIHQIITGKTCINIADCSFDKICKANNQAVYLDMLLSSLAASTTHDLVSTTGVSLTSGTDYYATFSGLEPFLNFTGGSWEWKMTSSGDFTITDASSSTTKSIHIKFDQTSYNFSGATLFAGIEPYFSSSPNDNFKIQAYDGSIYTPLTGLIEIVDGSTSSILPMGDCQLPGNQECQAPEYRNRTALENLVNQLLNRNGFVTGTGGSAISLINVPYFNSDLQTYFAFDPATPNALTWDNVSITNSGKEFTADFGNEFCKFKLDFINTSPQFDFTAISGSSPIVKFYGLVPDGTTARGIGSYDFTILAEDASGHIEPLRGASCIKVASCDPCTDVSFKRSNNWEFGDGAGLNFNYGDPIPTSSALMTEEGVASISDDQGNLLFYTDGVQVYDKTNSPMSRASTVTSAALKGNHSSTQSSIILQDPGNANYYYIITNDADEDKYSSGISSNAYDGVNYTKVDITGNNGNGEIVSLNTLITPIVLPAASPPVNVDFAEKVTVVKHSNGRDYWIVLHAMDNNDFYCYLLSPSGISTTPVVSSVGWPYTYYNSTPPPSPLLAEPLGYMKASLDGTKLAVAINPDKLVELFHFDRSSGNISDAVTLTLPEETYGLEFSPDGKHLYAGSTTFDVVTSIVGSPVDYRITQYPLDSWDATDMDNNKTEIYHKHVTSATAATLYGISAVQVAEGLIGALQIGPNGKIYIARTGTHYLDVINKPNESGVACDYHESAVYLGGSQYSYVGLPNLFMQKCSEGALVLPDFPAYTYEDPCVDYVNAIALMNGDNAYAAYIEKQQKEFRTEYKSKCLETLEHLNANFDKRESHYTLYYYDQAGNLVRTVPPKGVQKVGSADLPAINVDRTLRVQTHFTQHTMPTTYTYNSLNQLVGQSVPDNDLMDANASATLSLSGLPSGLDITSVQYTSGNTGFVTGNLGGHGVVYTTSDGGLTWHQVSSLGVSDLLGVHMYGQDNGFAVGKRGTFVKTTDGGLNWLKIPTSINDNLNTVFFKDADDGVVAGDNGTVYLANNFSTTQSLTQLSVGNIGNIVDMAFNDPTNGDGYAVVNSGNTGKIYHVTGTGSNWAQISSIRANDINDMQFVNNSTGFAVGNNGLVMHKGHNLLGWDVLTPPSTEKLIKVYFDQSGLNGVVISADNAYRTTDGGQTWGAPFLTASSPVTMVSMANAGSNGYILLSNGTLVVTTDGWASSTPVSTTTTGLPSSGVTYKGIYAKQSGSNIAIAVLSDDHLFCSGNGASSFVATPTPVSGCTAYDFLSTNDFVGNLIANGAMYYNNYPSPTFSGNLNWVSPSSVPSALAPPNDVEHVVAYNCQSPMHFYAATDIGRVFTSIDGGITWSDANTAHALSLYQLDGQITLSCPNYSGTPLYAAGKNGYVKISTDYGANWSDVSKIRPGQLNSIAFEHNSSGQVGMAVGDGGKIYTTDDGGSNWQMINTATTTKTLRGAAMHSATDWMAVGDEGTLLYPNGTDVAQAGGTSSTSTFTSAAYLTGGIGLIVGKAGEFGTFTTLTGYNANTPTLTQEDLNDIYSVYDNTTGPENYVAVGNKSVVLNKGTSGPQVTSNVNPTSVNASFMVNALVGFAVGNSNVVLSTADGGANWASIAFSVSPAVNFYGLYFSSATDGLLVGSGGKVYHCNGTAVMATGTAGSNDLSAVWMDGTNAITVGDDGAYTSTNNGASWAGPAGSISNMRAISVVNGTVWICGDGGKIYKGTDVWGTPTWTLQNIAGSPTVNFTDIHFRDDNTGWVIAANGTMYSTVDGGYNPWGQVDLSASGISATALTHFSFNAQGQALVAGTNGSGNALVFNFDDQPNLYSSRFWYDRLGRLVASQNSKQKKINAYSYTLYDALGRIAEVGQVVPTASIEYTKGSDRQIYEALFNAWVTGGTRTEVVHTWYDEQKFANLPITQENLRNRVASVTYEDTYDGNDFTFATGTHYSYDIHGNVKTALQDVPDLGGAEYMRLDYDYDLISGKVNQVAANKGRDDQFFHKYQYDADNRITNVWTSKDGIIWDQDAKYFYYAHGPLARVELGDDKVQAVDYAYTLQGWVKGVNSFDLDPTNDMGHDGYIPGTGMGTNLDQYSGRDAYAFGLNYYHDASGTTAIDDYTSIGTSSFLASISSITNAPNLYNGNIRAMVTTITDITGAAKPQLTAYKYDQLNRIKEMNAYKDVSGTFTATTDYHTDYHYDPNGNITALKRNGVASTNTDMDDMSYNYKAGTNQLTSVNDAVSGSNYADDIDDQAANNYGYDEIGELKKDDQEEIADIQWTLMGKVKFLQRTSGSSKPNLAFYYNPKGERLAKLNLDGSGNLQTATFYMRDPQGNIMATYDFDGVDFKLDEQYLYGSSRIGSYKRNLPLTGTITTFDKVKGNKFFELSNHLGNVLSVVSDRKVAVDDNSDGTIDFFKPEITLAKDYYPFGSEMYSRGFDNMGGYRHGFNGKEKDNEITGVDGSHLDYGARMQDTRLGRWLSVDSKQAKYPGWSPYHFAYCNPISTIDPDGNENIVVAGAQHDNSAGNKLMFAHQAISQIKKYASSESEESRTMIMFTEGYTTKQLERVRQVAEKYGATFITVNSADEVVNYVNSKTTTESKLSNARMIDPVTNIDAFSHGVPGAIEFGYDLPNRKSARFNMDIVKKINPSAFRDAIFNSYACRTGAGSDLLRYGYGINKLWGSNPEKSLAQGMANILHVNVGAYMTRSDYSNTLSSQKDRIFLKLMPYGLMPPGSPSSSGMNLSQWQQRLAGREKIDGAIFDPQGAVHPVQGGTTPADVPNEHKTFTPKEK